MTASVKTYRSFVSYLGLLFILAPCALMLLNYSMDPNNRYRLSVKDADLARLSRSEHLYLTLPENHDDRALAKKYILNAPEPSLVVFGGSRVLNIQPEMFKSPWSEGLMNVAMQAGTIRDYVALWQIIKSTGARPDFALLCVEEQSLNRYSQNDRFFSIYEHYSEFFKSGSSIRVDLMGWTTNVKDLLSLQTTLASIDEIMHPKRRGGELVAKSEHDRMISARAHSFSVIYPRKLDIRPAAEVEQVGRENGLGEYKVFEMWNREDRMGYEHLIALIRDMKQSGVTPVVIGMPYHPAAYEVITSNPTVEENMHYFVSEVKKLALEEEVSFYNAITENISYFKNEHFIDGVHLKRLANFQLFQRAAHHAKLDYMNDQYDENPARA